MLGANRSPMDLETIMSLAYALDVKPAVAVDGVRVLGWSADDAEGAEEFDGRVVLARELTQYTITVGEVGNEMGHPSAKWLMDDDEARADALRDVADYNGDGWWMVEDDRGQEIARGGRFSM